VSTGVVAGLGTVVVVVEAVVLRLVDELGEALLALVHAERARAPRAVARRG
jgi:hypothetical protein